MKVLQLTNKSPWPPKEGGPMAMHAICRGFLDLGLEVKVLCMDTPKFPVEKDKMPDSWINETSFESVFVDNTVKPVPALLNLLSDKSYHIHRFINTEYKKRLIQTLKEFNPDVVLFESIYPGPYLETVRKHSKAKTILRTHNVEHIIWKRLADNCSNPIKKIYLNIQIKRLKRFEMDLVNQFDGLATITEVDKQYFEENGCSKPIISIPFGMSIDDSAEVKEISENIKFYHLGSMDWMPNIEGVRWLIKNVWSSDSLNKEGIKLNLAGRNMPADIFKLDLENLNVVGEITSAKEFLEENDVLVVPLFSGSGIRIKILEAMAAAKPIISTAIGAEGINYTHKKDIIIANTADEFIEAMDWCSENHDMLPEIGKNARSLAIKDHDQKQLSKKLADFIESL